MVRNNILIGAVSLLLIAGAVSLYPFISKANPLEYLLQNQGTFTVTATTTLSYMTPGTGTTTPVYDTYANGSASTYATDKAALEVQFTASSTSSTLQWFYEYAQGNATANCVSAPNSCDWYADDTFSTTNATTTPNVSITQPNQVVWTFASTTPGGGAPTGNRANKVVNVPTPMRYIRAVMFLPIGSTNGAVWAAFVGQKQTP